MCLPRSTNGTRVCGVFEVEACNPADACCSRGLSKIEFHIGECSARRVHCDASCCAGLCPACLAWLAHPHCRCEARHGAWCLNFRWRMHHAAGDQCLSKVKDVVLDGQHKSPIFSREFGTGKTIFKVSGGPVR